MWWRVTKQGEKAELYEGLREDLSEEVIWMMTWVMRKEASMMKS